MLPEDDSRPDWDRVSWHAKELAAGLVKPAGTDKLNELGTALLLFLLDGAGALEPLVTFNVSGNGDNTTAVGTGEEGGTAPV